MPVYEADELQPSRPAAAALSTERVFLQYNSSNQLALAAAGGPADGVQRYAVTATGDEVTLERAGNMLVTAGGTLTAGEECMSDAAGKAITWAGCSVKLGRVLIGATVGKPALIRFYDRSQQRVPTRGANTASAAGPVVIPAADYFHVTGTAAITGWTNPAGIQDGARFSVIPDAIFTWTAAGNIALAGTAVVNKLLDFQWDATTAKWYPSYIA